MDKDNGMAIAWQKEVNGTYYQVRTAGSSVRLYTDGVFHSQYNQRTKISGGIWDLLMIPAFLHRPQELKRILVLGVGGGAVLRMFLDHFSPESITGIELNPTHIRVARKFFGLNNRKIELVEQDAVTWLKLYKGPPFDLVIDDLFGEQDGEPIRAVEADIHWGKLVSKNLSASGLLICNFLSRKEICQSGFSKLFFNDEKFKSAWIFENHRYDNQIAVFSGLNTVLSDLYEQIKQISKSNSALRLSCKNFTVNKLKCRHAT